MTTTAVISGQSIGTGANVGENLFAYKVTPQATTNLFFVEGLLTNGADGYDMGNRPRIRYACCSTSMTAALAPAILKGTARYLELVPSPQAGLQVSRVSIPEPLSAAYIYVWAEIPNVTVAQTLTVNIIESASEVTGVAGTPASSVVSTQGFGYTSSVSITRPTNTTAYTALDVLGVADVGTPANAGSAIMTFASIGPATGGWVWIDFVSLLVKAATVPTGMGEFKLHFYNASPTAILDNAAFNLAAADTALYLGYVLLPTPVDMGDNLWSETEAMNYQVRKLIYVPTGGTLYGELQTVNGFTPSASTVKVVAVHSVLN